MGDATGSTSTPKLDKAGIPHEKVDEGLKRQRDAIDRTWVKCSDEPRPAPSRRPPRLFAEAQDLHAAKAYSEARPLYSGRCGCARTPRSARRTRQPDGDARPALGAPVASSTTRPPTSAPRRARARSARRAAGSTACRRPARPGDEEAVLVDQAEPVGLAARPAPPISSGPPGCALSSGDRLLQARRAPAPRCPRRGRACARRRPSAAPARCAANSRSTSGAPGSVDVSHGSISS